MQALADEAHQVTFLRKFSRFWDTLNLKSTIIWKPLIQCWEYLVTGKFFYSFSDCFLILSTWNIKLIQIICLDEGSANCCLQDKSCSLPGFINKVSLAHSHAHCVMYGLWLLSHCNHRIVRETIWLAQPKIFTIWPFTEEVCWPLL